MLEAVVRAYTASRDFNGIPGAALVSLASGKQEMLQRALVSLIRRGSIEIVHQHWFPNPHIRPFDAPPVEDQAASVMSSSPHDYCVYPTKQELSGRRVPRRFGGRPYAGRLWRGHPQLEPIFFEMSVLDRYRLDPRYHFDFGDYSGMIGVADEYYLSGDYPERDRVLVQTFGIGYADNGDRVVAVFLRYLADLTPEHQRAWESFERKDPCKINRDYWRNAMGEFSTHQPIYRAFLTEQAVINSMCTAIGRPSLFRQVYASGRPAGFHPFSLPTSDSYNRFVLELDKLLSENINVDFFLDEVERTRWETRRDGTRAERTVGSVAQLETWLRGWFRTSDVTAVDRVIGPIKSVRKSRQTPAHRISQDVYDRTLWARQDDLMAGVYESMRTLRMILANYPGAETVSVPDWLYEGRVRAH